MPREPNGTTGESPLQELDDDVLRQAVERVRGNAVPTDALQRALNRAEALTSVVGNVRRRPAVSTPVRRTLWKTIGVACLVLIPATIVWTVGGHVREARETARRSASRNNLKQIGLALHDYHGADFMGGATRPLQWNRGGRLASASKKIIHSAVVALVVDELSVAERKLTASVERLGGFVADSQVSEPQGQPRTAEWTIRVPVDALDEFLRDVVKLGTPENRSTHSQDVTDEYVDLEARIATKKQLEQRILGLLETRTGDIKDVIVVEEQLARVRQEIESMEGRVKSIDAKTAMTTVAIVAREERDYVPPQAPTLGVQVGRTWASSVGLLSDFGRGLVLTVVALGPWLVLAGAALLIVRRALRVRKSRSSSVEEL